MNPTPIHKTACMADQISFAMFPSPQRGDQPARPRCGANLGSQNAEFQQATAVPGIAEATGRRAQICELRDFLWGVRPSASTCPRNPGPLNARGGETPKSRRKESQ